MHIPQISVLISVYNETERHIRESLESLLNQTFSDLEIILVQDNPKRNDVEAIVASYKDDRIKLLINESNIGLAMSMNRAAKVAQADIFARMDADDVALPNRLQLQYDLLSSGKYDFLFSSFDLIDMDSNKIDKVRRVRTYNDDNINIGILIHNAIHHPTVMMNRKIFEEVGGYRDFPCAQDTDLWFRMLLAGCRFHMMSDVLLHYRINPNSISQKRKYRQALTNLYIATLSVERLATGTDTYSIENYTKFINEHGVNSKHKENEFKRGCKMLQLSASSAGVKRFIFRVGAFLLAPTIRKMYILNKKKLTLYKSKYLEKFLSVNTNFKNNN